MVDLKCIDLWTHADWIQVALVLVSLVFGIIGAWFVHQQNKILKQQNKIMDQQNAHNEILLKMQSQKDWEAKIISDTKNQLLRTAGQAGLIQGVAQSLRNRYPNDLQTIVRAYAELASEDARFARVETFLISMRGYRGEDWPGYP